MSAELSGDIAKQAHFGAQLERAIANAQLIEPGDPLVNSATPNLYRWAPDEMVIDSRFIPEDDCVYTTEPGLYLPLIEEASVVLDRYNLTPETDYAPEKDAELNREIVDHELAHLAVAARFGNERTVGYVGIRFMRYPENEGGGYDFFPFYQTSGPLRKIHHAYVNLAPDSPSQIDKANVEGLGYDASHPERIRELAECTPPVEPEWAPPDLGNQLPPHLAEVMSEFLGELAAGQPD